MSIFRAVPFAGGSYSDETKPWTIQDTVNYIPTVSERPGTRSQVILKCCPGLRYRLTVGSGPIRGAHNAEGRLLVVSGSRLYWIKTDWSAQDIGMIPGVGRVQIAHNQVTGGNQVLIATGDDGYVYNTVDNSLTRITDEGYPGASTVRYAGQYLLQIDPLRRFWFHSDLADAFSYSTIDRYEAEASPDRLLCLEVNGGRVFVFGERTIEVYDNIVSENAAFARSGIVIDRGCASPHATCVLDNSIIFLGDDGIVYRMDGYNPVRISHHPMEAEISKSDIRRSFFTTWESRGHKIAYLTMQDGKTWGYDIASQEFCRRKSHGLDRWRVNTLTSWNGNTIAGDFSNGKLYSLDWDYMREEDAPIERERTFAVMHSDNNRVNVNAVRLSVDSGNQSSGLENIIQLRYSDDGGRNWSNWRDKDLGAEGNRLAPVTFRQMGVTRHRIYQLRDASPIRNDIISAEVDTQ